MSLKINDWCSQVDEVKKFLRKPSVEDGELEPGARFWCHFCIENVDKHVTDRNVSIRYGGVFEHFARFGILIAKAILFNKSVSQSCAVAKSEKFWRATGQSNLADTMEDCSIGQSAVV